MKKSLFLGVVFTIFSFLGCDSKSVIDESIIAKSDGTKHIEEKFEPKTYNLVTTKNEVINFTSSKDGINFKDYKGKKAVLINVFATWCPPCIKEIPVLKELKEKYKDEFEVVAVLFEKDKTKAQIDEFIKKHNITYPVTIGKENFVLAKDFGDIQKVPEMFLFSKNGAYVKKFVGETKKEDLDYAIEIAVKN